MDVDFFVGDIIVATENKIWPCFTKKLQVFEKFIEPNIFICLALISRCSRRKIGIDQCCISKVKPDNSTFCIALHIAISCLEKIGFYFCENSYTTITFFLSRIPIVVITKIGKLFVIYIIFMRL